MMTGNAPATYVRVIARLDIKGPNLVKGIQFDGNRVLGTPDVFAEIYYREGVDELIFYDTVASLYRRNSLLEYVKRTAERVFIPLTVAGGIRSVEDVRAILRAGADKVAINTAAVEQPRLITEAAGIFGSQCVVSSIEFHRSKSGTYEVWTDYGRQPTGVDAFDWARRVVELGAGEILLTSIDRDGMGSGFDIEFTARVASSVPVPVIPGGGAGTLKHFSDLIGKASPSAVSAASIFHYFYAVPPGDDRPWMSFNEPRLRMGENIDSGNIDFLREGYGGLRDIMVTPTSIPELKKHLIESGVALRPFDANRENELAGFRRNLS